MFEGKGRDQGDADGRADALLNLARRPRPDLILAILFTGYRDAYLKNYRITYDAARRAGEYQRSDQLRKQVRTAQTNHTTLQDRIFERGWKDGYEAREQDTQGLSKDDKASYQRGVNLGQRHREYEHADQLRKVAQHQKRRFAQDRSR